MFRSIGTTEIILILAVVVLLFGAKRLPDLARGTGRALRIFKTEIKDLRDDDETPHESTDASRPTTTAHVEPTRDPATTPDTTRSDTPPDRG